MTLWLNRCAGKLRLNSFLTKKQINCGCLAVDLKHNSFHPTYNNKRNASTQTFIENIVKTQSGLFKSLSESAPVELLQSSLLNFHNISGLPWWAVLVCSTVILRTVFTLPLNIYQQYIMAKLELLNVEMVDIVKELKKETAVAIRMYNWDERTTKIHYKRSLKKQHSNLIIRDNCHPLKAALLPWVQIPLWVSLSVSIRNMVYLLPANTVDAHITLLELSVGGFGWINNLTVPDSHFILPVLLGILNLSIIELTVLTSTRPPTKFRKVMTNVFRGFSILMVPLASCVPSCLVIYWTTSSLYGLIQNLVLISPKVKRFIGIPKTQTELQNPYDNVMAGVKKRLAIM